MPAKKPAEAPAPKATEVPAPETPTVDMEAILAKAKEEAEAQARDEASKIVAEAKKEAERIVAEARDNSDEDVVSGKVTKRQLINAYNKGASHMEIAQRFYGSVSDENMEKVAAVINPHFGITDDISQNVHEFEPGTALEVEQEG